jgi:hypothetical protein
MIFLNRRNFFLLFVFFFFVLLFQCCKKDKQVSNPIINDTTKVSKFDYKENFEDSIEVKSWILYNAYISNVNTYFNPPRKLNSKALIITIITCTPPCSTDSGSAVRNFTNFEGTNIFSLSCDTNPGGNLTLSQIRNGKFLKTKTILKYSTVWTMTDTFSLMKTDTLQIRLSNSYYGTWSGPQGTTCFDNLELRQQ